MSTIHVPLINSQKPWVWNTIKGQILLLRKKWHEKTQNDIVVINFSCISTQTNLSQWHLFVELNIIILFVDFRCNGILSI